MNHLACSHRDRKAANSGMARHVSLFHFRDGFHETQQCSELLKIVTSEGLYDSIGELDICVLLDESFNLSVFLKGSDHFEALTLSSFPVS